MTPPLYKEAKMSQLEKVKELQIISYKFEIIYYLKNKYILFKNKNNLIY